MDRRIATGLWLSCLAISAVSAARVQGQSTKAQPPQAGAISVTYSDRDPRSSIREQAKRFNWKLGWVKQQDATGGEYDLERESFRVFVPGDYRAETPHGLVVWISPGKTGALPADWPLVFERHKLLVVGADNSGNERLVWYRVGLAIDAAFNMKQRFTIDDQRIYVVGFSGGGRMASRVAMTYPDIFTGGVYMAGTDYFRPVPVPGETRKFWPRTFPVPTGQHARIVQEDQRHVFLIGSDDFNLPCVKATYEQARSRDGFAHVQLVEMPGVGHACADATNLERAIEFLDEPLQATPR